MVVAKRKRFAAEEIIGKLREAEVGLAQGQAIGQVARKLGVSEQTYYRWRREYGGLRVDQAKRPEWLITEQAHRFRGEVREREPVEHVWSRPHLEQEAVAARATA